MDIYRSLSRGSAVLLLTASAVVSAAGDAEIQKCITDKFAAAPKLSAQGFSAEVKNGTATLSGNAANPGSKGAATGIAKRCSAASVSNEIKIAKVDAAQKGVDADAKADAGSVGKSAAVPDAASGVDKAEAPRPATRPRGGSEAPGRARDISAANAKDSLKNAPASVR